MGVYGSYAERLLYILTDVGGRARSEDLNRKREKQKQKKKKRNGCLCRIGLWTRCVRPLLSLLYFIFGTIDSPKERR